MAKAKTLYAFDSFDRLHSRCIECHQMQPAYCYKKVKGWVGEQRAIVVFNDTCPACQEGKA